MSRFREVWSPYHDEEVIYSPQEAASTAVLETLRPRRGYETAKWLDELKQDITKKEPAKDDKATKQVENLMADWVSHLFEHFEQYALDFNQTAQGTDYLVNVTKPAFRFGAVRGLQYHDSKITTFEGYISTRFWALVVRGRYEKIEVFIIPADVILGFTTDRFGPDEYAPFTEVVAAWEKGVLNWEIGGHPVTYDMLGPLAGELFGDLIRVASGKMDEEELFHHHASEISLGKTVATGEMMDVQSSTASRAAVAASGFNARELSMWKALEALREAITADMDKLIEEERRLLASEQTTAVTHAREFSDRLRSFKQKVAPLVEDLRNLALNPPRDKTPV
jgi:hypothetical protein